MSERAYQLSRMAAGLPQDPLLPPEAPAMASGWTTMHIVSIAGFNYRSHRAMNRIPPPVIEYVRARMPATPPGFVLGLAFWDHGWCTIEMMREPVPDGCTLVVLVTYDFEQKAVVFTNATWLRPPQ